MEWIWTRTLLFKEIFLVTFNWAWNRWRYAGNTVHVPTVPYHTHPLFYPLFDVQSVSAPGVPALSASPNTTVSDWTGACLLAQPSSYQVDRHSFWTFAERKGKDGESRMRKDHARHGRAPCRPNLLTLLTNRLTHSLTHSTTTTLEAHYY